MLKLKRADYPGNFHGFSLKEGFWYGTDTETGRYIAASGWESNGNAAIYFLENEGWQLHWIDIEADFQIENIPDIETREKLSFVEWLEKEQKIAWNDWDVNYSGVMAEQIRGEYKHYLYPELPLFVQEFLEKNKEESYE